MALVLLVILNLFWVLTLVWAWEQHLSAFITVILLGFISSILMIKRVSFKQQSTLHLIEDGLLHMLDNNFVISLPVQKNTHAKNVISLFNQVIDKLRAERRHIFQRELLLDKVVNESNVVTVLVNNSDTVVFANHAARKWFETDSTPMTGATWTPLFEITTPLFYQQLNKQGNVICTLEIDGARSQSWHISRSPLTLNGFSHTLYLFKPMTEALNKKQLEIWKTAIRVISHELNNSIAPISSLCHSGRLLSQSAKISRDTEKLARVFNGISRRVSHLNDFVESYGKFARIGEPDKKAINTSELLRDVQILYQCSLNTPEFLPEIEGDKAQCEQALINLVKNACEAATESQAVIISASTFQSMLTITVEDDGNGISEDVIHEVMLPFFTTKQGGTGVGLVICKNVAEAHNGSLTLRNKDSGGLIASLSLPLTS